MGSPTSPTSPRWPMVTLNLDGSPREMRADLWRLVVGAGTASPGVQIFLGIDPTKSLHWETLDQLPELKELTYYGSDLGIEQYVARRASITTLTLGKFERSAIRIADSHVKHLLLSLADQPLRVALPPSTTALNLFGEMRGYDQMVVDAHRRGAGLKLSFAGDDVIAGLEEAAVLRCSGTVALAKLRGYRALEGLELIGCKSVCGLAELRHFARLERLRLQECYHLDCDELPTAEELPSLRRVNIDGIRRRDADAFKKKFGMVAVLELRGIRTDAWVQKYADSPFRDWAEAEDGHDGLPPR